MNKQLHGARFVLAIYAPVLGLCGCAHVSAHAATGPGMVTATNGAQKFTFLRKYTVGEKDVYATSMEMGTKTKVTMTATQTVMKLYDDGGADISYASTDMKMVLDGKDTPVPAGATAPVTLRCDKYGSFVGDDGAAAGGGAMPFSLSGMSELRDGIGVGQTVAFDTLSAKKLQSKGTVAFLEIVDGAAKLHVLADTLKDGKVDGHIDATMLMDMATAKTVKAEMTIEQSGGQTTHMVMTRQAS